MSISREFLSIILVCSAFVCGCSTRALIAIHDISEADDSELTIEAVANVSVSELQVSREEYWLVSLRSQVDLELIVEERNVAFLYYKLRVCGSDVSMPDLFLGQVYVDRNARQSTAYDYLYLAFIPKNYQAAIQHHTTIIGKPMQQVDGDLCIGLGAGNMAGQSLTTNYVALDLSE